MGLSSREIEIARQIFHGISTHNISEQLKLSYHTVRNHIKYIYHKIGISTRSEMLIWCDWKLFSLSSKTKIRDLWGSNNKNDSFESFLFGCDWSITIPSLEKCLIKVVGKYKSTDTNPIGLNLPGVPDNIILSEFGVYYRNMEKNYFKYSLI